MVHTMTRESAGHAATTPGGWKDGNGRVGLSGPVDSVEALFQFGKQSRKELQDLIASYPDGQWDVPQEHKILTHTIRVTPRKIVIHVLMHEIRHWAQIGTLLRLNGIRGEFQDFLFSPVLDLTESLPA